ncbi:MAG: transcriptional repressor NrdR [Deltaproteobacteria bacterium]|jgi:transcriptional repressor NrdR|nr:MAG: transcriptional repressor NrdR [Deltaproteobacteria bacterium]
MKCPFCGMIRNKVIDSRLSKDARMIRRRRECLNCEKRFTTYEKVAAVLPMVVKKDGRREPFNHEKIRAGIQKACQKRPISMNTIDDFVDSLGQLFQESGHREIKSSDIGERVIERLKEWDDVAYVRFASVYRQFKDINEFMIELKELIDERRG